MSAKANLELSRDEATALLSFASLGVAALSAALQPAQFPEEILVPLTQQAMTNIDTLGDAGWSALNDRIIVKLALVWPELAVDRKQVAR